MLSISADGTIKQWDSISGQVSRSRAPHTLGLVSLSVDPAGKLALYNTLEGLTCLWDLEDGEVKGSFESYARAAGGDLTEPCTCSVLWTLLTLIRTLTSALCTLSYHYIYRSEQCVKMHHWHTAVIPPHTYSVVCIT